MKLNVNFKELIRGGVVPLRGENNFSVWVKIMCNNITSSQLEKLADISEKYGKGYFLLTTNQIPIIPHVKGSDIPKVRKELEQVKAEFEACGSRIRSVKVCYSNNLCPYAKTNPMSLGEKLDRFFYIRDLRHKMKIVVAGCEKGCTIPRALGDVGFVGVGPGKYDVYFGGRLGLKPNIGVKVAENLSEEECVVLLENYVELLREHFHKEERAADVLEALGLDEVKRILTRDLKRKPSIGFGKCETKIDEKEKKTVIRVKALCGEITSNQARKLAEITRKYGRGFIHIGVRGTPEIPYVDEKDLDEISNELKSVDLEILNIGVIQERGFDNMVTCFGKDCLHSNANTQSLLKKIDSTIKEMKLDLPEVFKISASGCPNNCALSPLCTLGFTGVVEVEVIPEKCNGCNLCVLSCKVGAIALENNIATIDREKCKNCGECMRVCPTDAIVAKRYGFMVYRGGKDMNVDEVRLGAEGEKFLTEEEALQVFKEEVMNFVERRKNT